MKLVDDNYVIETDKNIKNKNIVLFSDTHINPWTNTEILKDLIEYVRTINPDFVTFPGDIMMFSYDYNIGASVKKLKYLLYALREVCDVYLSMGNHDTVNMNSKSFNNYLELNNIDGIHAMVNDTINLGDMTISAYSPNHDGFINEDEFIRQFKEVNYQFDSDKFNLLLNHNPLEISDSKALEEIKNYLQYIDLILSGHMHNGYVPLALEGKIEDKYNRPDMGYTESGLWFTDVDHCRGQFKVNDSDMIITKGVRRYTKYVPAFLHTTSCVSNVKILKK